MSKSKRIVLWLVVVGLVFAFAVCQKETAKEKATQTPKETAISEIEGETKPAAEAAMKEEAADEKMGEVMEKPKDMEPKKEAEAAPAKEITRDNAAAIIEMEKGGKIVIKFYPKDAPNTVDNFIKLTNKGFYNKLRFHRVIPGFMAQGGDPSGNGTGGPGYKIKAEFNSQKHIKGTLAMARSSHPDSAGSQFYICFEPQPHLDGDYTVFGQVIEGMDVVDGIQQGDVMKTITIVDKSTVVK